MLAPSKDRLHGTLDALILKTLCWGPRHGYAITRWLRDIERRRHPGRGRVALPRALPYGAPGMDRGRVGHVGAGAKGALLSAYAARDESSSRPRPSDSRSSSRPSPPSCCRADAMPAYVADSAGSSRRSSGATAVADQVDAELDFHLEMLTLELMEQGLTRDAARRRRDSGSVISHAVNAECRKIGLDARARDPTAHGIPRRAAAGRRPRVAPVAPGAGLHRRRAAHPDSRDRRQYRDFQRRSAPCFSGRCPIPRPTGWPCSGARSAIRGGACLAYPTCRSGAPGTDLRRYRSRPHPERESHRQRRARPSGRLLRHREHAEAPRRPCSPRPSLHGRRRRRRHRRARRGAVPAVWKSRFGSDSAYLGRTIVLNGRRTW